MEKPEQANVVEIVWKKYLFFSGVLGMPASEASIAATNTKKRLQFK